MPTNNNVKRCKHGRNFCLECHGGTEWQLHATPAAQVQGEKPETVAWLNTLTGDTTSHPVQVMDWDDEKEPVQALMTVAQHQRIVATLEGERAEQWRLRRDFEAQCDTQAAVIAELRAALSAPPAAGVPESHSCDVMSDTGNAEADRIIRRLMSSDPDFNDCSDAAALLRRLVIEEVNGPSGYLTWKDAAIAERMKRVAMKPREGIVGLARDGIDMYPGPNMNENKLCKEIIRLADEYSATPPASEQQQAVVLPEPFMFVKLHAGDVMDWTQDFSLANRWTEEGNTVAELYSGHDLRLAYEK